MPSAGATTSPTLQRMPPARAVAVSLAPLPHEPAPHSAQPVAPAAAPLTVHADLVGGSEPPFGPTTVTPTHVPLVASADSPLPPDGVDHPYSARDSSSAPVAPAEVTPLVAGSGAAPQPIAKPLTTARPLGRRRTILGPPRSTGAVPRAAVPQPATMRTEVGATLPEPMRASARTESRRAESGRTDSGRPVSAPVAQPSAQAVSGGIAQGDHPVAAAAEHGFLLHVLAAEPEAAQAHPEKVTDTAAPHTRPLLTRTTPLSARTAPPVTKTQPSAGRTIATAPRTADRPASRPLPLRLTPAQTQQLRATAPQPHTQEPAAKALSALIEASPLGDTGVGTVASHALHSFISPFAAARPQHVETADTQGDPAAGPAHLDQLAAQLYGRLRSHLSTDLLVGRERATMLTDL